MKLEWDGRYTDSIYVQKCDPGTVEVPGNDLEHTPGAYGMPHMCFVEPAGADAAVVQIDDLTAGLDAEVGRPAATRAAKPEGPVTVTLEIDRRGDGEWTAYKTIDIPESGYAYHVLPDDLEGEWIRLTTNRDVSGATAYFDYGPGGGRVTDRDMFAALADVDEPGAWTSAVVRSEGEDQIKLGVLAQCVDGTGRAGETRSFQVGADMRFHPTEADSDSGRFLREKVAPIEQLVEIDEASVVVSEGGQRFRLPKSHSAYGTMAGQGRALREVVTERSLLNAGGTFYILPRGNSGGLRRAKPLATHNKRITDFCSWRGTLVLAGCKASAESDGHYFTLTDGEVGLWFGDIDDLWKLGKPTGRGGPWLETAVEAGEPSDPYLMAGYDRKTASLAHDAESEVTLTLQVDPTADGTWLPYRSIRVPAGETVRHALPVGYAAHWVRAVTDQPCRATVQFEYE